MNNRQSDALQRQLGVTEMVPDLRRRKHQRYALVLVMILSAYWALLVLGRTPLDTGNTEWLWGDFAQVYIAWGQFLADRDAHWLSTVRMSFPVSQSVSLFDPMPLFLLVAKPFASMIAPGRQYFGWYFLACLVMQGAFGYLATMQALRVSSGKDLPERAHWVGVIGALFFVMAPYTAFRFQGHTALSSHWVLALSIWVTLRSLDARNVSWMLANGAVIFLAAGINPYLALMVGVSNAVICVVRARRIGLLNMGLRIGVLLATGAAGLYVFGFASGASADVGGYGVYSMNALGPIDPNNWASLPIDVADPTGGQGEGFQYMGSGAILLMASALLLAVWRRASKRSPDSFPVLAVLLVVATCYVLALSTTLTFASHVYQLPVPDSVIQVLGRFRASGRFFWIAGFWLILIAIVTIWTRLTSLRAIALLAVLLLVQIIDLLPYAERNRAVIAAGKAQVLGHVRPGAYDALLVFPPWQCDPTATPGGMRNYESVGMYALRNGLVTNNFYAARNLPEQLAYHCNSDNLLRDISVRNAYLLSADAFARHRARFASGFDCASGSLGDSSWVCVPKVAEP